MSEFATFSEYALPAVILALAILAAIFAGGFED
jgi:Flp pilus assembly pilin Flp